MKKVTLALMCMLLAASAAMARGDEPKSEISLGYGLPFNTSNMCEFLADAWTGGLSNKQMDKDSYIGPLSLEYYYHTSPVVGVGVIGIYSRYKGLRTLSDNSAMVHKSKYFTVMPAVKLNWLRRGHWGLYSKAGIGYSRANYTTSGVDDSGKALTEKRGKNFVNFQLSLLGAEAGFTNVRAFAELGFGEQGVILGGIRMRF